MNGEELYEKWKTHLATVHNVNPGDWNKDLFFYERQAWDKLALELNAVTGEDIHTKAAAEMFGVDMKDVTPEQRRAAKTANWGTIYGITPRAARKMLVDGAKTGRIPSDRENKAAEPREENGKYTVKLTEQEWSESVAFLITAANAENSSDMARGLARKLLEKIRDKATKE